MHMLSTCAFCSVELIAIENIKYGKISLSRKFHVVKGKKLLSKNWKKFCSTKPKTLGNIK